MYRIKFLILSIMFISLTACGYKPSSTIIKKLFDDEIYVEVHVDKVEPENAPFVQDEMNRLVYTRFKERITNDKNAKNKILINYRGSSFQGVSFDERGFVTRYRVNIYVNFKMDTKKGTITKRITTITEEDIQPSSTRSSKLRIAAIRKGLEKALDEFLAYASVQGVLKKAKKQKVVIPKVKVLDDNRSL